MYFNPHTPVAQKVADEVVFARAQVKESNFFKIEPHSPPEIFYAHFFENTNSNSTSFHFTVGLIS